MQGARQIATLGTLIPSTIGWSLFVVSFFVSNATGPQAGSAQGWQYFCEAPWLLLTLLLAFRPWEFFWLLLSFLANFTVIPGTKPDVTMRLLAIVSPWMMAATLSRWEGSHTRGPFFFGPSVEIWDFQPFLLWATGLTLIHGASLVRQLVPHVRSKKQTLKDLEAKSQIPPATA